MNTDKIVHLLYKIILKIYTEYRIYKRTSLIKFS